MKRVKIHYLSILLKYKYLQSLGSLDTPDARRFHVPIFHFTLFAE